MIKMLVTWGQNLAKLLIDQFKSVKISQNFGFLRLKLVKIINFWFLTFNISQNIGLKVKIRQNDSK